ncbi:TPA: ribonuclease III [Candidatus Gracilibacteria bacterium]|nr:ribonuclease III [Flavobacteriaceae bacterium]HIQ56535.1 ribonuclease III [Candidatus Gracilibacteria bacterium]HIQ57682.1 ribonuclease III [Candidatus Gracilibacteria bacterium]
MPENIRHFLSSVNIQPKNISLYETAFTHKSFGNEKKIDNNERLEFLGDAVLELLVTEFLYKTFPDLQEGIMTALRSSAVRKESLANLARVIQFGSVIKFSKGERHGHKKEYILANTVEALIGALYLDRGLRETKKFLAEFLFPEIVRAESKKNYIGPKSRLQEWAQAEKQITPTYKLVSSFGPDHSKTFSMAIYLEQEKIAEGTGNSKQAAEQAAAANALLIFKI